MSKLDELKRQLGDINFRLAALKHPIPDETHEQRQERLDAYYQADRRKEEILGEIRVLDPEGRQSREPAPVRDEERERDPEEQIKERMRSIDKWADQPEPSRDQDKKLVRDDDRPLWERPARDDEERERPDRDERER